MYPVIKQKSEGALILFTTKAFRYLIPEGLSDSSYILKASNLKQLSDKFILCYQPKQIHSKNIAIVTKKTKRLYAADGIITDEPGLLISIKTADCVPILLYDKINQVVAAVHSGWRGTDKKIVRLCIEKLTNEFGTDPSMLNVYIGPSIRDCCYEVSDEIAKRFRDYNYKLRNGKPFLDLASINRKMVLDSGVNQNNIHSNNQCTGCQSNLFYSWRKRKDKGRMYAIIGLPR